MFLFKRWIISRYLYKTIIALLTLTMLMLTLLQIPFIKESFIQSAINHTTKDLPFSIKIKNVTGVLPVSLHIRQIDVLSKNPQHVKPLLRFNRIKWNLDIKSIINKNIFFKTFDIQSLIVPDSTQLKLLTSKNITFHKDNDQKINNTITNILRIVPFIKIEYIHIEDLNLKGSLQQENKKKSYTTTLFMDNYEIIKLHIKQEKDEMHYHLSGNDHLLFKKNFPIIIDSHLRHAIGSHVIFVDKLNVSFQKTTLITKGSIQFYDDSVRILQDLNDTYKIDCQLSLLKWIPHLHKIIISKSTENIPEIILQSSEPIALYPIPTYAFLDISLPKFSSILFKSNVTIDHIKKNIHLDIQKNPIINKADVRFNYLSNNINAQLLIPTTTLNKKFSNTDIHVNIETDLSLNGNIKAYSQDLILNNMEHLRLTHPFLEVQLKGTTATFNFMDHSTEKEAKKSFIKGTFDLKNNEILFQNIFIIQQNIELHIDKPFRVFIPNDNKKPYVISSWQMNLNKSNLNLGKIMWNSADKKITFNKTKTLLFQIANPDLNINGTFNGSIIFDSKFNITKGTIILQDLELPKKNLDKNIDLHSFYWIFEISQKQTELLINITSYNHNKMMINAKGSVNAFSKQYSFNQSPMHFKLKGKLDVGMLTHLFGTPDNITGILDLDLNIAGSLDNPKMSGNIEVINGVYESFINGTYIANLNGKIKAYNSKLNIDVISGNDKRKNKQEHSGTVDITGSFTLNSDHLFDTDLTLKINNLTVVKRDDMFMKATGNIFIKGAALQSKITGSVILSPSLILLDELTNDDITSVLFKKNGKIQKTKKEKKRLYKTLKRKTEPLFPIDLELIANNNFELKGKGVKSFWHGKMYARGDFSDGPPYLEGAISLKEGNLSFFGKPLILTKGEIIFDDYDENNPIVKLEGFKSQDSYELYFALNGRANDTDTDQRTKISFYSKPALTEDSVMSMILFGKKSSEISAGQSVQLAAAGASLNSKGKNSYNVFDSLRGAFGFDIFELKENDVRAQMTDTGTTAAQSLQIGKEIAGVKIYLNQGVGSAGTKATISKEIFPSVSVDVDFGDKMSGSGAGLNWVKQY